jgi:hypothetical protein
MSHTLVRLTCRSARSHPGGYTIRPRVAAGQEATVRDAIGPASHVTIMNSRAVPPGVMAWRRLEAAVNVARPPSRPRCQAS